MSEALAPAPAPPAGRVGVESPGVAALPAVIVDAGPPTVERFLKLFAVAIANGGDAGYPRVGRRGSVRVVRRRGRHAPRRR